jgi:phosphatidylserine decarboxylase
MTDRITQELKMSSDCMKKILHYLLPKRALTVLGGFLANVRLPAIKNYLIQWFIKNYQVDMQEALMTRVEDYPTFNAFFIRHLKPGCRPVADVNVVSPVDGTVSELGVIHQEQLVQAKGRTYRVDELLTVEAALCEPFYGGSFATLYLSPKDYHRVHMPMDALLQRMVHVPGSLFSVQPATTRVIPRLFARNERLVVFFDTTVGPLAMVLVGATIVGSIGTTWHGDLQRSNKRKIYTYGADTAVNTALKKSEEMGYFKLGSTVILLFPKAANVQWMPDLCAGSRLQVGQALAVFQ